MRKIIGLLMFSLGLLFSSCSYANTTLATSDDVSIVVDDVCSYDVVTADVSDIVSIKVSESESFCKSDFELSKVERVYFISTITDVSAYTPPSNSGEAIRSELITAITRKAKLKGVLDAELKIYTSTVAIDCNEVDAVPISLRGFICSFNRFNTYSS